VLASFKPLPDGGIELWVTNDTLAKVSDKAVIRRRNFDGTIVWEQNIDLDIPANSSQCVSVFNPEQVQTAPDGYLAVCAELGSFMANRYFLAAIKDLKRAKANLQADITVVDEHEVKVTLTAEGYAFFAHLLSPNEDTVFSDNYFDMEPGEKRVITIISQVLPVQPELIQLHWR
jgi:beta-mannosidase